MIERCQDYRRVKKFLASDMVVSDKIIYLMETKDDKDLGVWTMDPFLDGFNVHAKMGPECRGRKAVASLRAAFEWVFENTGHDKIYAAIPNSKRAAQMVASWSGMVAVKTNETHRGYIMKRGCNG